MLFLFQIHKNPTSSWTKEAMVAWLQDEGIAVHSSLVKKELLALCQMIKKPIQYELDEFVEKTTHHKILRLPPYHPIYNPIEMVWGLVKRYHDAHIGPNHDFSQEMCVKVWEDALATVTPAIWKNCCEKTEGLILEDYRREISENEASTQEGELPGDTDHQVNVRAISFTPLIENPNCRADGSSVGVSDVFMQRPPVRRSLFPRTTLDQVR